MKRSWEYIIGRKEGRIFMIKYSGQIKQDFLSSEWVNKLQEARIELIDSKYFIVEKDGEEFIATKDEINLPGEFTFLPTYTLSELLYKLPEYAEKYGGLSFLKDAPFYLFYFRRPKETEDKKEYLIETYDEFPIIAAARLLIICAGKKELGYVKDVSDKGLEYVRT